MRKGVRVHHIHYGPKCYKYKLLGKLVVPHGIKALFGGRSCLNLTIAYLFTQLIKPVCKPKNKGYT